MLLLMPGRGRSVVKAKIKGVNTVRKRLADGSVAVYYYHRETGARLPGLPGEPAFLAAFTDAEKIQPKDVGNVNALIRDYLLSLTFEKKAASTQREYKRMLMPLGEKFGKMPIKALESPRVRGVFLEYQEEIGRDRPREADNRLSVLSAVFTYAARKGRLKDNPLAGFERIYSGDRSEMIWTAADIATFMQAAPLELQQALILALHTGQRYGDLIRLRWADFQGETISLRQNKTKARVTIHVSQALRRMLDSMGRAGPYILTRTDGRPWFTQGNDKELVSNGRTTWLPAVCGRKTMPICRRRRRPSICASMICAVRQSRCWPRQVTPSRRSAPLPATRCNRPPGSWRNISP